MYGYLKFLDDILESNINAKDKSIVMSNYTKKALFGSVNIFLFSIIGGLAGYVGRFYLSKKLTISAFGLFFAVFAVVQFLDFFRSLGIETALVKFISEYRALKKYDNIKTIIFTGVSIIFVSTIIISSLLLLLSGILAKNYFKTALALPVLIVLSVWFFTRGVQDTIFSIFYGFQDIFIYSLREVRSILYLVSLLIIFVFFEGILVPAFAWLASSIIIIAIFLPILKKRHNLSKYKVKNPKKYVKKIVKFSFPVMLNSIGDTILGSLDILVLTYFATLADVGVYSIILPTSLLLFRFSTTLIIVSFPISSYLWAKKQLGLLKEGILSMYKYLLLIIAPIAFILISYSFIFLDKLFGADYTVGHVAFKIIMLGVIFGSIAKINNSVLTSIGKPQIVTRIILASATINLITNLLLIPKFGIVGAATATLFSFCLMFMTSLYYLTKFIKFRVPWISWTKIISGSLLILVLANYMKKIISASFIIETGIILVSCGLFYGVWIFITRTITLKEIKKIVRKIM